MGLDTFTRFFARFRHPVSLPEDVAKALGISVSNFASFDALPDVIRKNLPRNIKKFMKRETALKAFSSATAIEQFHRDTICSYAFKGGWLQFDLRFDEHNRLRRLFLHHKNIVSDQGLEIRLSSERTS